MRIDEEETTLQNYRFSMDRILDWRSNQEEEAQNHLHALQNQLNQEKEKLNQLLKESRKLKSGFSTQSGIDTFRRHDLYKDLLNDKIVHQKQRIAQFEKKVSLAQDQLSQAHRDKKVMEKLEEKELAQFKEVQKKEEQKQLDEISTLQYSRRLSFHK